jgi:protoporphyrinogen/coproporphyrinogen III oxidase
VPGVRCTAAHRSTTGSGAAGRRRLPNDGRDGVTGGAVRTTTDIRPESLPYASLALVTFVLPRHALDGTGLDARSGALIPAIEGRIVKAITVFTTKWGRDGDLVLRASVGRFGEEAVLQRADLADAVQHDLEKMLDTTLAPTASLVTRWGGALPQYPPGHLATVAALRGTLPETIALAGAAWDGVGIPACVRSGELAADRLIGALT